jgi:two-component system, OmpR family, response regulator
MPDKKVLIIDDETDFCLLMKNYFKKRNFEVHIRHTLSEGLTALQEVKPDILFLDNNLPDGLGWEHTEYIVSHFPQTHINLISAFHYNDSYPARFSTIKIWEKPISLSELNGYMN